MLISLKKHKYYYSPSHKYKITFIYTLDSYENNVYKKRKKAEKRPYIRSVT
jgi:hypothetical protein